MASSIGQKELKTEWPVEEGLTAGTQKQTGRVSNLVAENSVVSRRQRCGLNGR